MAMRTLIKNATIVNEGRTYGGCIAIEGDTIGTIASLTYPKALHPVAHSTRPSMPRGVSSFRA